MILCTGTPSHVRMIATKRLYAIALIAALLLSYAVAGAEGFYKATKLVVASKG